MSFAGRSLTCSLLAGAACSAQIVPATRVGDRTYTDAAVVVAFVVSEGGRLDDPAFRVGWSTSADRAPSLINATSLTEGFALTEIDGGRVSTASELLLSFRLERRTTGGRLFDGEETEENEHGVESALPEMQRGDDKPSTASTPIDDGAGNVADVSNLFAGLVWSLSDLLNIRRPDKNGVGDDAATPVDDDGIIVGAVELMMYLMCGSVLMGFATFRRGF